jgi:hypothetical protein
MHPKRAIHLKPAIRRSLFTASVASILMAASLAQAQVNGFNSGVGYTVNGTAVFQGANTLNITTDVYGEANSVYYDSMVNDQGFIASFDYYLDPSYPNDGLSPADGFTFVLQDDSRGTAAVGDAGGNLGYAGSDPVTPSVAVAFNVFYQHTVGTSLLTDGNNPANYNDVSPVQLLTDPVNVFLNYSGSQLVETLTDLTTSAQYQTAYTIDIAGTLGSSTAFVGFTGGDASGTSLQHISNFQYQAVPEPSGLGAIACGLGVLVLRRRRRWRHRGCGNVQDSRTPVATSSRSNGTGR